MDPAGTLQYLAILAICVGMTTISQLFRYFFGMKPQASMDMQQQLRDMQQEMTAIRDDPEAMQRLQQEAMQTYRTMMRKQLIPNCIYMVMFFVLWAVIRRVFANYYFFGMVEDVRSFIYPYLIFSFSLSGIIALIRYLIKLSKRKKGELPDENYDSSLDRGIQSGLRFGKGWNADLSPELNQMRSDLKEKQNRGEIPEDIDIDAELRKISDDEEEEEESKDWKKRLDS